MHRIWLAFINSMRALKYLARHEKAVQQELALLVISIPVAFYIAPDALMFMLMIGAILFLIMIEVLNTGIEAACNAFSREFHEDIQIAKDCGSLAVLISIILAAGVWGYALFIAIYQ
ncbi:diacylglycerol kinase [Brucella sp. IR073]|uniref:diacylglycerol kinase n=1 Tax=unclassified Brucella TaxID=2632610 RepID=UPI003B98465B